MLFGLLAPHASSKMISVKYPRLVSTPSQYPITAPSTSAGGIIQLRHRQRFASGVIRYATARQRIAVQRYARDALLHAQDRDVGQRVAILIRTRRRRVQSFVGGGELRLSLAKCFLRY